MAQQRRRALVPQLQRSVAAEPKLFLIGFADYGVGAIVAAVTMIVYCLTAARDIVVGDTPELITAAVTLGVPHPPGYPLFTLLGHLFSLLPLGPLPFRLNLMSMVCGIVAVVFVYFTALRLSRNRAASACAALVLAFTPVVWSWSLVAEVFSLNNALAAAMIYFLVVWHEEPERLGLLAAAAFLYGLGLANQLTIVLLGPGVLFTLYRRRKHLIAQPRAIFLCVAALLVGLLPYVYLPWSARRQPLWNWGNPSSLTNFLAVVTRKHFGTLQLANASKFAGGSPFERTLALGASFSVLAGLLLLSGAIQTRRRWYFKFSMLGFAFAGPIFAAYANLNVSVGLTRFVLERFFPLVHVIVAPLMAFGALSWADLLSSITTRLRPVAVRVAMLVVLAIVAAGVVTNCRDIDQSRNHTARRFAEDVFATLEPNSILLMNGDEVILPMAYLQDVEGYRKDVVLIVFPFLNTDWYLPQLRLQYPKLAIPFRHYDEHSGTIRMLLEANADRRFAVDGATAEHSLDQDYWYHRHGLVDVIEPMSKDVKADELIAETEELFKRYRPPSPGAIKWKSLEPTILSHYATPAFVVAQECRRIHDYKRAREWYQRALAQDPSASEVREILGQLP